MIPVVVAANGMGMPVRRVNKNAPLMQVATNGFGTPIVYSDNGTPFVVLDGSPRDLFVDGVQGAWYDPSDLSTLFQDAAGTTPVTADGQSVRLMLDKSGNGNHIVAPSDAARPLYKTSGGLHWLEANGTAHYMRVGFTVSPPWQRVSALRQISFTSSDIIYGGFTTAGGNTMVLQQITPSPNLRVGYSSYTAGNSQAAVGADFVASEIFLPAEASLKITTSLGSSTVTAAVSVTTLPGGFSLFTNGNAASPSFYSNVRFYGAVMRPSMTTAQVAFCEAYMASKSGVTLP